MLQLVADCVFEVVAPPHLSSSLVPSPQLLNCKLLLNPPSSFFPFSGPVADNLAAIPPPLIFPLSGTAADYSATIPPPLVSPLSSVAADYRLSSKLLRQSPSSCFSLHRLSSRLLRTYSSASYTSPLIFSATVSSSLWRPLSPSPPSLYWSFSLRSAVNFPSWLNYLERTLSSTLVSGFNLWFVTQQSGSGAIPKPASAPTSISSDPYADGLCAAIAETERIAATAQASAAAAPDNAVALFMSPCMASAPPTSGRSLVSLPSSSRQSSTSAAALLLPPLSHRALPAPPSAPASTAPPSDIISGASPPASSSSAPLPSSLPFSSPPPSSVPIRPPFPAPYSLHDSRNF
ncbi:unnamed protein product [Closterium sp. NIES-65]|nr:unnamed protein product [Closterium sp. NIES-65]CAI5984979.1 unnamed protein product [Closterium sp. NIES-65]